MSFFLDSDGYLSSRLLTVGSTKVKDNESTGIGTVKGGGFPSAAPPLAMAVVAKESHEEIREQRCML